MEMILLQITLDNIMDGWVNMNCNWLLCWRLLVLVWALGVDELLLVVSCEKLWAFPLLQILFDRKRPSWTFICWHRRKNKLIPSRSVVLWLHNSHLCICITPEKMIGRWGGWLLRYPSQSYIAKGWVSSYEKQRGSWILAMHCSMPPVFFLPNFPGISNTPMAHH